MTAHSAPLMRAVAWGEREIAYGVSFGRRRRLAITVHPDLSVAVAAPEGRSLEEVEQRVYARRGWIARRLEEFERLHPLPVPRSFVSGETHRYLGRQYRLRVRRGEQDVRLNAGRIEVTLPHSGDPRLIEAVLWSWYHERARVVFARRVSKLGATMHLLRMADARFVVRKMKTRWGSCSPRGTITLNAELVQAPAGCIDYVIVHELCHLEVLRHSRDFYRLLSRVMPDWPARQARLNALR